MEGSERAAVRRAILSLRRFAAVAVLLLVLPSGALAADPHPHAEVPFVPTPPAVVDAMLDLARLRPEDYIIDLGSGDGRIIIGAAKKYGARGFGVEIDQNLVAAARREARRQGVAERAQFLDENLFVTELGRATVITMYLFPSLLLRLRPRLFEQLKPGARIVSHDFDMEPWKPDAHLTVPVPDKPYGPPSSEVYLWIIPANAAGTWQWRVGAGAAAADYEVMLSQAFQMLEGRATVGGRPGRLENGRMRGEGIRFMLTAELDGRSVQQEFGGRISGDEINGWVRLAGGGEFDWKATRVRRGSIDIKSDR
jgi:SAM-dependent methyltransferase